MLRKPAAYQTIAGQRRIVAAGFVHRKNGATAFRVGGYDQTRLLTIDPIFDFSTYLDGSLSDQAAAVTTDSTGNIYLTGTTASTDFPTQNPEQTALGCSPNGPSYCQNAFVTKLDPTGKTLIYSTYVGGSAQDFGATIAVDGNGHAIIGGVSDSANFPKAGSVPAPSCQTNWFCYFVASLSADGSSLNYSGLIGGEQGEYTNGNNGRLTVDSTGNAYLAGVTGTSSFDITPGTLSTTVPGYPYTTMFVLKVDPTGKLIYSTIVPGNAPQNPADVYNNWFLPSAIAVNSSGQAIVAGTAGLGLPTTAGVVSSTFPNDSAVENASAGFILQLNATASAINYATYLPGTDLLGGMAVDLSGNIYVAGTTSEINLPVGPNAYQSTPVKEADGGIWTGYIAKLNATATSVLAATYLDGTNASLNNGTGFDGLALDSNTNVFVGGFTGSSDFPLQDPFTSQFETGSSEWEMVLAEMTPDLSALEFGSFLSSTNSIYAGSNFAGLAVDSSNHLIVTGTTNASNFPTTAGSFETQPPPSSTPNASYIHSFVSKIDMSTAAPSVCSSAWSISLGSLAALSTSQTTLNVTNCGNAALNFNNLNSSVSTITASQSCGSVAPGAVCPITITFAPIDSTTSLGTLSLADNAALSPQVIQVSGQGKAPSLVPQSNPFAFGHLLAGASGVTNSLLISNNGNAPLNIQSATIGGPGFSIAQNQCTQSVPAGSICLIGITFGPTAPGNYQGTLTLDSNDPVHPSLAVTLTGTGDSTYGVPTISQVIGDTNTPQQSLQINNGAVTLNLVGANFYPQSVVQLNGVAQQSTFFSNTAMQAVIAASSLSALGEFPLTVVNPTPGGGSSTPVTMTTFEQLPVNPNALVSVPATGLLYAAMPSTDATNPNTVLPINPATGNLGTPIPVGQNPTLLAPSSDGNYLYVANATDLTVQRISLQSNSVDETFPFPLNPDCTGCTLPPAVDLKSVPGSPQEVILSQGAEISLYNSSGLVNYIPTTPIYSALGPAFGSMAFAGNPVTLYAEPFTDVQNPFFNTAQITNSGLSWTEPTGYTGPPAASYGSQVVSDGNLLYTDSGEIWNPVTQSMIGTFPVNISYGEYGDLAIDTTLGQIFATGLGTFPGPPDTYIALAISSYGLSSHAAQQTVAFPINASENYDLARWGSNGFAFVVSNLFSGSSGVYLVRSSALAGDVSNPVPGLSSITPNSATAGSAAITLNVNGSSFVSGAVVSWNGTALPTAYVSAAQLTAAVPASDIASAGTALVTVTNPVPGGGISAAETFTINPATPGITLSPTSLSFGSINVGVSSAAQPIMLQNSGSGALSLSGIGVSGDFSETNTCGASIAVGTGCTISVIFTPTAAGSRTGALTISSNATGSPQSAALSGTGVMTTPVVTLAPEQLTFGSQAQGVASGAQSITLANSGTAPLAVSVIAVSGDFAQTNTCPSPLGVGDTCSIAVTFTPTATGARTGSLSVTDN
ncbi:MAG TPA: choice-of-anchor D domain-containing protein, partial [Bryobacteraceae bacterium]